MAEYPLRFSFFNPHVHAWPKMTFCPLHRFLCIFSFGTLVTLSRPTAHINILTCSPFPQSLYPPRDLLRISYLSVLFLVHIIQATAQPFQPVTRTLLHVRFNLHGKFRFHRLFRVINTPPHCHDFLSLSLSLLSFFALLSYDLHVVTDDLGDVEVFCFFF